MATAIPELIGQEIVLRLEAITEANDYDFTVPFVVRPSRDARDWTPKANAIAVIQEDDERNPAHDCPGNPPGIAYVQPFTIQGYVRKPERQDYPDTRDVNQMIASIKKAVAGTSDWHQFDGNAYNADWGATLIRRTKEHTIASLDLRVMYRVSEYDPFTIRH